jgi:hypothetical protein
MQNSCTDGAAPARRDYDDRWRVLAHWGLENRVLVLENIPNSSEYSAG